MKGCVFFSQSGFGFSGSGKLGLLRSLGGSQAAHLNQWRAIEVETVNVKPSSCGRSHEPALDGLGNVRRHVVTLGAQEPEALVRAHRAGAIAFEAIARRAGIYQVFQVVRSSRGRRLEVVNLELTSHRGFGHTAIGATSAEGRADGHAFFDGDCHSRCRQRIGAELGERVENGSAALVELGQEASAVGGEASLLCEEARQLFVLGLKSG